MREEKKKRVCVRERERKRERVRERIKEVSVSTAICDFREKCEEKLREEEWRKWQWKR